MAPQSVSSLDLEMNWLEQCRAADALEKALRLIHLDDVWTFGCRQAGHPDAQNLQIFKNIADEMKALCIAVAQEASWLLALLRQERQRLRNISEVMRRSLLDGIDGPIADKIANPDRLFVSINTAVRQLPLEVRQIDEQWKRLADGGSAKGDLSAAGRCAIYGCAAVLAVASGQALIAFVAGVGIGAECL